MIPNRKDIGSHRGAVTNETSSTGRTRLTYPGTHRFNSGGNLRDKLRYPYTQRQRLALQVR
jgi:hypothetical protein